MVTTKHKDYRYFIADDGELDKLLRGEDVAGLLASDFLTSVPLQQDKTGVLVSLGSASGEPVKPLALVCQDHDIRRLCGRYAQLRTELSPLTAWCHMLTPRSLRNLDGIVHKPTFGGTKAAWSGLVVAETMLLSGRNLANIRISACLASATYAIGRSKALWSDLTLEEMVERFDFANKLCRGKDAAVRNEAHMSRVRSSFLPMWNCLSLLSHNSNESSHDDLAPCVKALRELLQARTRGEPNEATQLVRPILSVVPEAQSFERLSEIAPEARLGLFDELVRLYKETGSTNSPRRYALALASGYLATVAAGGSSSLALVADYADTWPELTGWAYLIGGIGERITWTSGFDGLGRLVARELERPIRLDEPPTCDFSLDEAIVLSDPELKEPLVHLKIKQAKVVSVALFPGVNIAVPIVDVAVPDSAHRRYSEPKQSVPSETRSDDYGNVLSMLARALWPHFRPFVIEEIAHSSTSMSRGATGSQRSRRKGKSQETSQLPLADRKR